MFSVEFPLHSTSEKRIILPNNEFSQHSEVGNSSNQYCDRTCLCHSLKTQSEDLKADLHYSHPPPGFKKKRKEKGRLEDGLGFGAIPKLFLVLNLFSTLLFQDHSCLLILYAFKPAVRLPRDVFDKCGPGFVLRVRFATLSKINQRCRMWCIKWG